MNIMRVALAALAVAGISFWAGGIAGKPQPQAAAASLRDQMIGTWKLAGRSAKKTDGSVGSLPEWDGAPGYISYDSNGFMSVQFMKLHRDVADPNSYTAYFGTYTVDETTRTVTHHIIGDVKPDGVGRNQPRQVTVEGDRLSLTFRAANSTDLDTNSFTRMKPDFR